MSDAAMPERLCQCGCGRDPGIYKSTNRKHGILKGQPKRFVLGHHVVPTYTGCSVDQCTRPHAANGWCALHNERMRRHGTTNGPKRYVRPSDASASNLCECGCGRPVGFRSAGAKGSIARRPKRFIHGHARRPPRPKRPEVPCDVPSCDRTATRTKWCHAHYMRWRKHGDVMADKPLLRQPAPEGHKKCPRCHQVKPLEVGFYKRNTEGRQYQYCRSCVAEMNRASYERAAERRRAWQSEYRKANADKVRESDRERSRIAYADAIATGRCAYKQGRGCAAAARSDSVLCDFHRERSRQLSWDKYHGTFVDSYLERGLTACWLCGGCFTDTDPMQHDHLVPWADEGPDDSWNIAPAHARCNNSRGRLSLTDTIARWHPNGIADQNVADAVAEALRRFAGGERARHPRPERH